MFPSTALAALAALACQEEATKRHKPHSNNNLDQQNSRSALSSPIVTPIATLYRRPNLTHPHRQAKSKSSATEKLKQQEPDASVSAVQEQSAASLTASKLDQTQASDDGGGGGGGGGTTTAGVAGGGDATDAGIDLTEEVYAAGVDEAGARVLCAWLNANVATSFIEVRGWVIDSSSGDIDRGRRLKS